MRCFDFECLCQSQYGSTTWSYEELCGIQLTSLMAHVNDQCSQPQQGNTLLHTALAGGATTGIPHRLAATQCYRSFVFELSPAAFRQLM